VPAALGAALACPDETIWVIVGDGGFQMTNQELATIRQENVRNVKICIVNNGFLGMVRQWQELFEDRVYSATTLSGPCFRQLAEAYGVRGITVDRTEDVEAAFEYARDYDNSVVIDFRVEQEANVFRSFRREKALGDDHRMTHTLVAMVRDRPAVLNRAVSVLRRRGVVIDQLVLDRTEQPGVNRMTVSLDTNNVDQVVEQLRRLIDVLTVRKVVAGQAAESGNAHHFQADGVDEHVTD